MRVESHTARAADWQAQNQKWRYVAATGGISPAGCRGIQEGRVMQSLCIFDRRVERFSPNLDAAPRGPPMISLKLCCRRISSAGRRSLPEVAPSRRRFAVGEGILDCNRHPLADLPEQFDIFLGKGAFAQAAQAQDAQRFLARNERHNANATALQSVLSLLLSA